MTLLDDAVVVIAVGCAWVGEEMDSFALPLDIERLGVRDGMRDVSFIFVCLWCLCLFGALHLLLLRAAPKTNYCVCALHLRRAKNCARRRKFRIRFLC